MIAWRLSTFTIGTLILVAGAMFENIPDWDFWNSVLMATTTYLVMPRFDKAVQERRLIEALGLMCLPVVVVYDLYNDWAGLPTFPWANFQASTMLFLMCWVIWYVAPAILAGLPQALHRYLGSRPSHEKNQ